MTTTTFRGIESQTMKQPKILDGGNVIEIYFPVVRSNNVEVDDVSTYFHNDDNETTQKVVFHALWLWTNRQCNFMKPSGQRIHSPGTFHRGIKIHKASIELLQDRTKSCSSRSLLGSVHPISMNDNVINDSTGDDDNNHVEDDGHENEEWILVVTWTKTNITVANNSNNDNTFTIEGDILDEKSYYNISWLRQWSYDHQSLDHAIRQREVNKSHTFIHKFHHTSGSKKLVNSEEVVLDEEKNQKPLSRLSRLEKYLGLGNVSYSTIADGNQEGLLDVLDFIFLDGAAIITDVPNVCNNPERPIYTIGKMVGGGSLSHASLYGSIFHVKSTPNAINIAYTSTELCPHQDLAYYESKPGLQLLHCVANDTSKIKGGESILIDAMAAAYEFRSLAPHYFETLTKCNATFVKQREGAFMVYSRPHIQVKCHESDKEHTEIVAVHWAPPFEGPLRIPAELIQPYFEAYSAFELMVDKSINPQKRSIETGIDLSLALELSKYANDYTWEYRLNPGEMIVFNNTRMLHGRRAFEEMSNVSIEATDHQGVYSRHLIGAYTNIDDSLNAYRTILKSKDIFRVIPNVGNGTGIIQAQNQK